MTACVALSFIGNDIDASAANVTLSTPKMIAESKYESSATHPYGAQTSRLTVRWNAVKNAKHYQIYIKGGEYKTWTKYRTVTSKYTYWTIKGLSRAKTYYFRIRAVNGKTYSEFSKTQTLRTARMNYDNGGWEAMCRIVYHEVGQINDSMWDKPMVYVSDCIVNRYVAAKYLNNYNAWYYSYKNYPNVQSIIYNSGGFMSSAGLANDGAVYSRVPSRVKEAVYSSVYNVASYKNIQHDYSIYFWSNTSYKPNSYKVAYSFRIPWGYFNVWRQYWG